MSAKAEIGILARVSSIYQNQNENSIDDDHTHTQIQKVKVDAICDVLRVCKTEEQLKDIWDAQSSLWKKDFGDFGFKVIEEHKNRFKKELSKQVA